MKFIKLFTLLVLFSLQAEATGYSHNMFVAHKKLQAGKENRIANDQALNKKAAKVKVAVSRQPEVSFTQEFAKKLSGVVTLNQRIVEEGPSSLFSAEEEKENDNSIVSKLASAMKGLVYAFIKSSTFGKA